MLTDDDDLTAGLAVRYRGKNAHRFASNPVERKVFYRPLGVEYFQTKLPEDYER